MKDQQPLIHTVSASAAARINAAEAKKQSIYCLSGLLFVFSISWLLLYLELNILIEITAALAVTLAGFVSDSKASTADNTVKPPVCETLIPAVKPLTLSESWDLLWSDEFNGAEINKKKREHIEDCWLSGDNE
ncbi:hypothetical protein [Psychromonas aquimarina]|uniref:hypothetical protein n=1 Tax=Psychromonas aquimarina TaxID=444919 RepID=UPI00048BBA75|nr:hypothetical protein [Psychromonas aquimarina]